jgi:hypothetical protein
MKPKISIIIKKQLTAFKFIQILTNNFLKNLKY